MTGRGIDQILPHPSRPQLFESYVRSAVQYVELAEQETGVIKWPVDFAYVWGEALAELARAQPQVRIANLETAVTTSEDAWPGKGVHYRMHPANVPCLAAAKLDCCVLANNHVIDWGRAGLAETLSTLHQVGIRTAGAGHNDIEAAAPAVIELPTGSRVLVFAGAMSNSGVSRDWAALENRSGVNWLKDFSPLCVDAVQKNVRHHKRTGDIAVMSIHWGDNWGYEISPQQRNFARQLIEFAGIDIVHGHSSHHVKGIEVYRGKPILYGCGDLLNDYEGIGDYESYRADLALMYFPEFDIASGRLLRFDMTATQIRHLRINRASESDAQWLVQRLNREGAALNSEVALQSDGRLTLCSNHSQRLI
jgi:poly-gamma-glutamate synthesis protein (capsule biosynthesis protein)